MDTTETTASHVAPARPTHLDDPRAYEGVLTRRSLASLIDVMAIAMIVLIGTIVLTIATLGLGLLLYVLLPVVPIVTILYVALTVGSPAQATWGMRLMGVRLERTDGGRVDAVLGAIHSLAFWASVTLVTPLILLVGLFTDRRRLVHDILLGTVVVRSDTRLR